MRNADRKDVTLEAETWEQLRAKKGPSETWDEFLLGLVEQVPRKADIVRLEKEHIHAIARLDDVLDLDGVTDPEAITEKVTEYREEHPLLDRLASAKDLYIESEHSTGDTQPSQTVTNLIQAHNEGHRCLFIGREKVAERVYNTIEREPVCCRSSHPDSSERRFYTGTNTLTIDGETMTRPGATNNVWVQDLRTGEYILRDTDGTVHARFDTAAEIFTDASAYPDGGDRTSNPL